MTEQAKFTEGPWKAVKSTHQGEWSYWIEPAKQTMHAQTIAATSCCGPDTEEEENANAALIAAAPELYEALQKILTGWNRAVGYGERLADIERFIDREDLRALLAKAEGGE